LLWTFVRDPAARALSQYYHFEVSRENATTSYAKLRPYLEKCKSLQYKYLLDVKNKKRYLKNTKDPVKSIRSKIMNVYDFIGLVERMEESLAVMQLLWNVPLGDLMVLSAKQSGGYDDGRYKDKCFAIQKPKRRSRRIQGYLQSSFMHSNHDYALYAAVNKSLDNTIEWLGTERVQSTARRLSTMRRTMEQECQQEVVYPCSHNGTLQEEAASKNCYWKDCGCGYPCVDRVLEDYSLR
jgi:hypothetical protein